MSTNASTPDPTAGEGERGCRSRNPEPPHQRCENVVCDGSHRDYPSDPRKAEARWTTPAASTDASEGLTEDEQRALRDALVAAWRDDYSVQSVVDGVAAVVAQIRADAEAKVRADLDSTIAAIERLAAGWEASSRLGHHNAGGFAGALRALLRDRAARIARGDA